MHKVQGMWLLGLDQLTHDGRVCAVLNTSHGVDAGEDSADVVLVELDGVGVCEEVIALGGSGGPVGVCAPAHKSPCLSALVQHLRMACHQQLPSWLTADTVMPNTQQDIWLCLQMHLTLS